MKARIKFHQLIFKTPGGTSRGILKTKDAWFLILEDNGVYGIGECSVIYGLSVESKEIIENKLSEICHTINNGGQPDESFFIDCPAVLFAYEVALLDLKNNQPHVLFNTPFLTGSAIPINGLVWMGDRDFMYNQIKDKIEEGFKCIKIKIAAIDFGEELGLLKYIRSQFAPNDIQIRVDANGGFRIDSALENLKKLSLYNIHSIEQPIKQGSFDEMAVLCEKSPIDIALDEELIGVNVDRQGVELIEKIKPHYIILKPSLLGGFKKSQKWIDIAEELNIDWWITSALESNIGLSAIAQWTYSLNNSMYQGLGTGKLFTNNIPSPLVIKEGALYYKGEWDTNFISRL